MRDGEGYPYSALQKHSVNVQSVPCMEQWLFEGGNQLAQRWHTHARGKQGRLIKIGTGLLTRPLRDHCVSLSPLQMAGNVLWGAGLLTKPFVPGGRFPSLLPSLVRGYMACIVV